LRAPDEAAPLETKMQRFHGKEPRSALRNGLKRKRFLLRMKPEEELQKGRGEAVRWMQTVQVEYTPYCLGEQKRC
jgi:hypothetical protein